MNRLAIALLAAAGIAGCGDSTDAPSGPVTVTVGGPANEYVLVSEPPGIQCGRCNTDWPQVCPDKDPPTYSECSFDFEAGTTAKISLTGTLSYMTYACQYDPPSAAPPDATPFTSETCDFTVATPVSVTVTGIPGA